MRQLPTEAVVVQISHDTIIGPLINERALDTVVGRVRAAVEFAKDGYDYAREFVFGLNAILDGLERYLGP